VDGVRLKGAIVYPIKLVAEARYFFKTFPFGMACKIFWASIFAYRKNH